MTRTILVVEDDAPLAEALVDTLELEGFDVLHAPDAVSALRKLERSAPDLVVSDVHMRGMEGDQLLREVKKQWPDIPVLLMTAYGSISKAVEAMREGAVDYLTKPFEAEELVIRVRKHLNPEFSAEPVAEDPKSRELLGLAARVASTDATVMILGESGTGKEVLARYIHNHSARSDGPFVAINCAAIPDNMLEATLFGHEKGAFTGAHKATPGKFEQAQGGTLLLDEISEMELGLQAKLLRVLQEREVERLGSSGVIDLDVRVLATSNRNMKREVAEGRFREDLFYRLNVFPLTAVPLRERPVDVVPMAQRFLAAAAASAGRQPPTISPEAERQLQTYHWPGNVRELDNLMQRALILQPGDCIEPGDLHFEHTPVGERQMAEAPGQTGSQAVEDLSSDLKHREYDLILEALKSGSRKDAAEKLGISPRTLRYKIAQMREAGISVPG